MEIQCCDCSIDYPVRYVCISDNWFRHLKKKPQLPAVCSFLKTHLRPFTSNDTIIFLCFYLDPPFLWVLNENILQVNFIFKQLFVHERHWYKISVTQGWRGLGFFSLVNENFCPLSKMCCLIKYGLACPLCLGWIHTRGTPAANYRLYYWMPEVWQCSLYGYESLTRDNLDIVWQNNCFPV